MKHSDPGPMSDPGGGEECPVRALCVDLCNLIAESRVPGLDERGYGAGVHCPPLLGPPRHACDLTKPECQKHQIIIQHLLEAAASNIFQIEVLLLPECCVESKLKERIQNKEYILMERWSMNFTHGKVESNIEISHLLRAVRSFLHFSQLSAWFSSTSGKSPANICYWVNPELDALSTSFKEEPEVHSFPICKINDDLYGTVKVEFPPRTQYIPIVPCSKHPPICRHSLREINKDSNVCQNLSDSQMVRQLHKTSDTEPANLTTINYAPEPTTLVLTPSSLLKTLSVAIPDGSKVNRVLKHSNLQENLSNTPTLSLDVKSKNIEIIPKKPTSFVCNYAETISLDVSQENFCCNKNRLARHLRKTELKLKKLKKEATSPHSSESFSPILQPDIHKINQNTKKHPIKVRDLHHISNLLKVESNENPLNSMESSLVNIEHAFANSLNLGRPLGNTTKAFKRKGSYPSEDNLYVLPNKLFCDKNIALQIPSAISFTTSQPQCIEASQLKQKVDKEFTNHYSSYAIPSYCNNDTKIFEENYQHGSNYLFPLTNSPDRLVTKKRKNLLNFESSHSSTELERPVVSNTLNQSKVNDSKFNSELKLSKRKFVFLSDSQVNVRKKSKPLDEYNESLNFHSNSTCKKQMVMNNLYLPSSSNAQESNSNSEKDNVVKKSHIHKRKLFSMSNSRSNTSSHAQKTNLRRSYRLLLASDQMQYEKSEEKLSNLIYENVSDVKQISSCKPDCVLKEKSCVLKEKSETPSIAAQEKLLNEIQSENVSIKKKPLSKERKRNAKLKNVQLNKLFKFKKSSCQTNRKRKNSLLSLEHLSNHKISNTCPTAITSTIDSSFNESESNSLSSNVAKHLTIHSLHKSDSFTTTSCKNDTTIHQFSASLNSHKMISLQSNPQSSFVSNTPIPIALRNLCRPADENLELFPTRTTKFPKAKKLLLNFEESILKGCLPVVNNVKGFHAEIGASGSFCPSHLTLPADVSFYELGPSNQGTFPYVAHVSLKNSEYYLPKKGAVQVTLFNPSETVVKMFVLNYDLSTMPPLCHTFIRQKTYYLPVGANKEYPASQRWLRFIIHLRFASSKTGRITLHEDFKIVVLNKTNDDAASEFSQEPRELCSFLSVPMSPTFSAIQCI